MTKNLNPYVKGITINRENVELRANNQYYCICSFKNYYYYVVNPQKQREFSGRKCFPFAILKLLKRIKKMRTMAIHGYSYTTHTDTTYQLSYFIHYSTNCDGHVHYVK